MLASISLVVTNFMFCHRYDDINLVVVSISFPFQIAVERKKRMPSRRVESGFQSGHETQFSSPKGIFRKVMLIPAVDQPLVNLYSRFPLSFREIYFQQLGLSCFVFSQLRFSSDASNMGMLFQGLLYLVLLLGIQ